MADACIDMPNYSTPDSSSGPAPQDFLRSITAHPDLLDKLANDDHIHPEADIRQRFLNLRTIRANWTEWRTRCKELELMELMRQISDGKRDVTDPQCLTDFENLVGQASFLLDCCSKNLKDDTEAAQAPEVPQWFADIVFRPNIYKSDIQRALNGEPISIYGSKGTPVPPRFTSLRGSNDHLFGRVITQKLMIPFNHRIYIPLRGWVNKCFRSTPQPTPQGLTGRVLDIVTSALECMLAVLLIASSVIVLYNVQSMKNRIIATTFLSLAFPYFVIFLSDEAMRIFTLTAAYRAVTIVFISTSNYSQNTN